MAWYSTKPQSTYNRIFNFVIGVRGGGKTFNALREAIERYLKTGEEFIYLRRHVVDLDDACVGGKGGGNLFSDILAKGYFEGHEFKVSADKSGGYNFYLDGKVMGYGRALSTSGSRRSTTKPNVTRIIFDEFLIDATKGSRQRYLNGGEEMFVFANFYETIARGRDIAVYFIGNAFSMVNPYFLALNIRIPNIENNKIYKGKAWTLVFWRDEEFIEGREQTQFFQAMKDTKFTQHAYGNDFYLDSEEFIKRKPKEATHHFSVEYNEQKWGVWVEWEKQVYYISKKGGNTTKNKLVSLSMKDNTPNNTNIRKYRNMPFMKLFRRAVDNNQVFYETQQAYNQMNEVIYLLRTIT